MSRLDRYLILANQAGSKLVFVLTETNDADGVGLFQTQAEALQRDLPVIVLK